MLAGVGRDQRRPGRRVRVRPDRAGRRDGLGRLQGDPRRVRPRARRRLPGHRAVALRRRAAARGRPVAARGRRGVRHHDPRLGPDPADLRRPRRGRRRCGVRPGADRHRHHGPGGARLRHRSRRRPVGHRRGRRHGAPRRPRAARAPQRRRPRHHRHRGRGARRRARTIASLLGQQGTLGQVEDLDLGGLLPGQREAGLRRAPARRPACSTRAPASSCTSAGRRTSSTTLGRLGGRTVGVVANNPLRLGRLPRLGVRREGRPVRADVRRARRAAGRAGRRARLPARRRARSGRASSGAAPSCCTRSPSASCPG